MGPGGWSCNRAACPKSLCLGAAENEAPRPPPPVVFFVPPNPSPCCPDARDFAARLPQKKPILGYCYGAAVMSILGILDVCRPVHAPLGMDLSLYAEEEEYPPDLLKAQLQCLTGAIKGTLTSVSFPPGLELQNEAAARFAQGQLQCEGFVLVALLQIIYSVLGKLIPHGTKVLGGAGEFGRLISGGSGKGLN